MKGIIVSSGKRPSKELLVREMQEDSIIICADGGAQYLYEYNIKPNCIIGDFDSINVDILEYFKKIHCKIETYPKEKDNTDTELALSKAIELGANEICFLGCTGSRLDHVFGNFGLLNKCLEMNIIAQIKDDNNTIEIIDKPIKIKGNPGDIFSLQAYESCVEHITIKGAKYCLKDFNLYVGNPLTISNEFLDEEINIDFNNGKLILFFCKD